MVKTVVIIQARSGSSRLPGKVLMPILGTPMLVLQIERIKNAKKIDAIVVATSDRPADDTVAALAETSGVGTFRGSEKDVLGRVYLAAKEAGASAVVRITGDCPLMDPRVVDEVVEQFKEKGVDYTLTPSNYPEGLDCEVFTFAALERAYTEAKLPSEREHVTPYIRNHPELFKIDTAWRVGEEDNSQMHWSVDTQNDFDFVSRIVEALYPTNKNFSKDDVLALLKQKPQLLLINKGGTGYEGLAKSLEEDKKYASAKALLIIGCGSIGARHARNARSIGARVVLADPNIERARVLAQEIGAEATFADYREAAEKMPLGGVVVATPSSLHVKQALWCAGRGLPLFIEKPLATELAGLDELLSMVAAKKVITMMGQSYRFHEGFLKLKELLDKRVIGTIKTVEYVGGQYLPDWHPKEDYRKEYAAQKRLGGGAMFTSMSHALDNVEWLFGRVVDYSGSKSRKGDLEIDVDDTCDVEIGTDQNIKASVHFDFLAKPAVHFMKITGEQGSIEADFIAHKITVTSAAGKSMSFSYEFEANKRYVDELQYFLTLLEKGESDPALDVAHGRHLVELMCDPRIADLTSK